MGRRDGSSIGVWDQDLPDDEWVVEFLRAIGSGELPQELIAAATPLVPVFRRGPPIWESELAPGRPVCRMVPETRRLRRPQRGFRRDLRRPCRTDSGASARDQRRRPWIQFAGRPVNEALLALWRKHPYTKP